MKFIFKTTRRPPTTRLRLFPNRQQQITYQPQTTRRPQTFTRFTSRITTTTPRSFTQLIWRTTTTTPRSITATTLSTHKPTKDTFSLIGNRKLIQCFDITYLKSLKFII